MTAGILLCTVSIIVKFVSIFPCVSPEQMLYWNHRLSKEAAYERAESGDIVTLSPACAAFDQFANFMERGKAFKKLVVALPE